MVKPSKEERVKYTYTKIQRKDFIKRIKAIGIPTIIWEDRGLITEEYSMEHLLDWIVTEIEALKKTIEG